MTEAIETNEERPARTRGRRPVGMRGHCLQVRMLPETRDTADLRAREEGRETGEVIRHLALAYGWKNPDGTYWWTGTPLRDSGGIDHGKSGPVSRPIRFEKKDDLAAFTARVRREIGPQILKEYGAHTDSSDSMVASIGLRILLRGYGAGLVEVMPQPPLMLDHG